MIVDYIFSLDHELSHMSVIMRKLDRYNNSFNYTSSDGSPFDFRRLEQTPTSNFKPNGVHATEASDSPTCKKQLFLTKSPGNERVSFSTVVVAPTDGEIE